MSLRFLFLTLLPFLLQPRGSEAISVSNCTQLKSAIGRVNNGEKLGEIQIPQGVVINVDQCSGLHKISKTIFITGLGSPAPRISGGGLFTLFYVSTTNVRLTLTNLILESGTPSQYGFSGGCVYIPKSSSGIFSGVVFQNCTAPNVGGAIFSSGSISLNSVQFSKNSARQGGAIGGDGTISSNSALFAYNKASTDGGAIYSNGKTALTSTQFLSNIAFRYGGAVYLGYPSSISNSIFNGNQILAKNDVSFIQAGGAVYGFDDLNIVSSNFTNNSVSSYSTTQGGALYLSQSTSISKSIFFNNTIFSLKTNISGFSSLNHDALGGAVFGFSSLRIVSSTFNSNQAQSYLSHAGGGAIAATDSLVVVSSSFTSNLAIGHCELDCDELYNGGGAIYNRYTSSISSSKFVGNSHQSLNSTYSSGGAIFFAESDYSDTPSHQVSGCTFVNNSAIAFLSEARGGAISGYSFPGTISLIYSNFSTNTAVGGDSQGGAVLIEDSGLSINRCTFTGNSATAVTGDAEGGAVGLMGSTASNPITYSTFRNNRAVSLLQGFAYGGAIYQFYYDSFGDPTLPNPLLPLSHSVFQGNSATGIIGARGGSLFMDNFQILSCSYTSFASSNVSAAVAEGGAIYAVNGSLSFCKGNSFASNNYATPTGKPSVVNTISAERGNSTSFYYCPLSQFRKESSYTFTPRLACGGCDCSSAFNPCASKAICKHTTTPLLTTCQCPSNTTGNGFICKA